MVGRTKNLDTTVEVKDLANYGSPWMNLYGRGADPLRILRMLNGARWDGRPLRFRFSGPDAQRAAEAV